MSKKVPKFSDSFETRGTRKKKGKGPDYYKQRYINFCTFYKDDF